MIHTNQVAELMGVTVRTLRYYDKIGLLIPAGKTDGGHRLYTNGEIKRLQQIQFLKRIGFKLQEIREMLETNGWGWAESLKNQLSYVIKEQENLKMMEKELRGIIHGIAIEGEDNGLAIRKIMHLSGRDKAMQQSYKDAVFQEREKSLWKNVPSMTSENADSLEWIALLGQMKLAMGEGPDSVRVQNIIRRMEEKKMEKFEGEEEFLDKLWEIRKSPEESDRLGFYPIDQSLLEFMEKAHEIYNQKVDKE